MWLVTCELRDPHVVALTSEESTGRDCRWRSGSSRSMGLLRLRQCLRRRGELSRYEPRQMPKEELTRVDEVVRVAVGAADHVERVSVKVEGVLNPSQSRRR